jgi:hypothetical protein
MIMMRLRLTDHHSVTASFHCDKALAYKGTTVCACLSALGLGFVGSFMVGL